MRALETRAERWFRCCAKETTAPRSRPQRGRWRNMLRMIVALRYRARPQFGRTGRSPVLRPLASGRYSCSSGLSSRLREPGKEPRAAEEVEVEVEAGGSGRCWVAVGAAEAAPVAA